MSPTIINLCTLGFRLEEVVDALSWGLGELGYTVTQRSGAIDAAAINILFAGFGLNLDQLPPKETRLINYNFEQIGGIPRVQIGAEVFSLMRNLPNWDYSRGNIAALDAAGIGDTVFVPVGYAPTLERITHVEKDIDVLFYGSINERRERTLNAIRQRGLKVVWDDPWDLTREQRDERISRAKVVLNLAFYDGIHVFEEVRVSYLLANRVCVLSELTELTQIEDDMRRSIDGTTLDELPGLCMTYCANTERRSELAERGYRNFKARDWLTPLRNALDSYQDRAALASRAVKYDMKPPPRINIGSGKAWRHDFINIDISRDRGADVIFDLSLPFPFESGLLSWRFGNVRLPKDGFDYILAEHVFEHVQDLVRCMTNCIEWLREGGTLELEVPYDLSYGAWQDPTHVRAFNERSWAYYTDWCWYVGWREHRFDLVSQVHVLSELGQSLIETGVPLDVMIRTPRAVDALRVKLVKRALTNSEKLEHAQYFRTVS